MFCAVIWFVKFWARRLAGGTMKAAGENPGGFTYVGEHIDRAEKLGLSRLTGEGPIIRFKCGEFNAACC